MTLIIQLQLHHISCYDPIIQSQYLLPTPISPDSTNSEINVSIVCKYIVYESLANAKPNNPTPPTQNL